mmetsp:Transcript_23429/g.66315  ORF Transcript_23429/g.66315 Transcript_23429/m.66315 type:complete len:233 (-) Transcript_23429:158-856(-)
MDRADLRRRAARGMALVDLPVDARRPQPCDVQHLHDLVARCASGGLARSGALVAHVQRWRPRWSCLLLLQRLAHKRGRCFWRLLRLVGHAPRRLGYQLASQKVLLSDPRDPRLGCGHRRRQLRCGHSEGERKPFCTCGWVSRRPCDGHHDRQELEGSTVGKGADGNSRHGDLLRVHVHDTLDHYTRRPAEHLGGYGRRATLVLDGAGVQHKGEPCLLGMCELFLASLSAEVG